MEKLGLNKFKDNQISASTLSTVGGNDDEPSFWDNLGAGRFRKTKQTTSTFVKYDEHQDYNGDGIINGNDAYYEEIKNY